MNFEANPLDNLIWSALATVHSTLATAHGEARRYSADVSPLVGLRDYSERAFDDLSALVLPDETVALFTASEISVPASWEVERERWIDQMIFEGPSPPGETFSVLGERDVPEMLTLTAATEPGPFKAKTIEMGLYLGIRAADGTLAAMAGERLRGDSFTEISAVCTDPNYRGKGYAGALVLTLCQRVIDGGRTPILHVKNENGARGLYEKLGFRFRHGIKLTVIRPHSQPATG